jgi:hypothetical protein
MYKIIMIHCQEVISKFKKLSQLYGHIKGNMIFNINNKDLDIMSIPFHWNLEYLPIARANVYRAQLEVIVFETKIIIPIYKPSQPLEVIEFEEFFGFESHCGNYDPNKIIAMLPTNINTDFKIDEILQTDNIDYEYCQETIKLLCLGGFIKYWKGVNTFIEWFKSEANIELNSNNTFKLLLNNFVPIIKKE